MSVPSVYNQPNPKSSKKGGLGMLLAGLALLALGLLWVVAYYLSMGAFPLFGLGGLNLLAGLVLILGGAGLAIAGFLARTSAPSGPGTANLQAAEQSGGTNGFAIASLVIAITGGGAVLAIVFGHIARSQIRRTGERGVGMALAGLIIGYVTIGLALAAALALVIAAASLG
jgi:hypothetical protein